MDPIRREFREGLAHGNTASHLAQSPDGFFSVEVDSRAASTLVTVGPY